MATFKYLKKKHMVQFSKAGTIRLGTLYSYRATENKALQDEFEGRTTYFVEPSEEPVELNNDEAHKLFSPHIFKEDMTIMPKAHVTKENTVLDAFVFCTSSVLNDQLMKKWDYDAYYKIVDPLQFGKIIFDEMSKSIPLQAYRVGKVSYVETKQISITNANKSEGLSAISDDPWDGYFTKPQRFKDEKEIRMVFVPEPEVQIGSYRYITCKELLTCCKFE